MGKKKLKFIEGMWRRKIDGIISARNPAYLRRGWRWCFAEVSGDDVARIFFGYNHEPDMSENPVSIFRRIDPGDREYCDVIVRAEGMVAWVGGSQHYGPACHYIKMELEVDFSLEDVNQVIDFAIQLHNEVNDSELTALIEIRSDRAIVVRESGISVLYGSSG